MNVEELRERVADQLQYAPDLERYRKDVRRVISDAHEHILLMAVWPWRRRVVPIWVHPDVVIRSAELSIAGTRLFALNAATVLAGRMYASEDAAAGPRFQEALHQAEIDLVDPSKRALGAGNWQDAPFAIELSTPGTGVISLYPDPRCAVTAITGNEGDFVLRFPRYRLPADCSQVLGVQDDEGRPLRAVTPAEARQVGLDLNRSGSRPTHLLVDGGFDARTGPLRTPLGTGWTSRNDDQYQLENEPVRSNPPFVAVATNAGSNALLASTEYRVFCSWYYGGRFGPPSRVVTAATTATNRCLSLSGLPVLSSTEYGRTLSFWVAEPEGAFYFHGFNPSGADATRNIDTRAVDMQTPWTGQRWEDVYPGGPYTYVRPWPRPDTWRRLRVEYVSRPRELVEDVDEPDLPREFHLAVLHQAILMLGTRHEGEVLKQTHAALLNQVMGRLIARYAPELRYRAQKGSIDSGSHKLPRLRSVNWQGP